MAKLPPFAAHPIPPSQVEILKEKVRDNTGKAAAAEALLEAERERNKVAKAHNSELKAAIRKLATLKETGEYTPRVNAAINDTSPPPVELPKDTANLQQIKQLKNENIYLRKQVSSEIQCKKELQKVVESQNERLQSTNVTIRNLEGKLKAAESAASIFDEAGEEDKENQGSSSGNSQHPLEVENESLRRELKEVTDCYQASRKNLAVTQKALENTRAINSKTESEMGILNAQLEETKGELEGQAKHHSDMAALLENKVEAAERKAEGVERHYEEVRKGTEVDGRKKLACVRMSMAVMRIAEGGTSGDCRLREAFFSWAFKSASKRGEEIKEDAEIAAPEANSIFGIKEQPQTKQSRLCNQSELNRKHLLC